jgi:TolB-like protein
MPECRPGRALQTDLVAVAIGRVQKLIVVAAPSWLARMGRPKQPEDLREDNGVPYALIGPY